MNFDKVVKAIKNRNARTFAKSAIAYYANTGNTEIRHLIESTLRYGHVSHTAFRKSDGSGYVASIFTQSYVYSILNHVKSKEAGSTRKERYEVGVVLSDCFYGTTH
jgi:hypothetical protein